MDIEPSESLRLRHGYAGKALLRERRWRTPQFERRSALVLAFVAILANLAWIVGLDQVMVPSSREEMERGPIEVRIILPPETSGAPRTQPAPWNSKSPSAITRTRCEMRRRH